MYLAPGRTFILFILAGPLFAWALQLNFLGELALVSLIFVHVVGLIPTTVAALTFFMLALKYERLYPHKQIPLLIGFIAGIISGCVSMGIVAACMRLLHSASSLRLSMLSSGIIAGGLCGALSVHFFGKRNQD